MRRCPPLKGLVKLRGGNTPPVRGDDTVDEFIDALGPLPCQRGHRKNRGETDVNQLFANDPDVLVEGLPILFHQIPFIE